MPDMIRDMLMLETPVIEKIIRTVLVYLFILLGLRLLGKRELGQWSPSDLIVLLLISETAQNAMVGDDMSVTGGLIAAATLLTLNHFLVRVSFFSQRGRRLLEGTPDDLIKDGHMVMEALERNQVSREELAAAARRQDIENLSHVRHARLEVDGDITFYRKEEHDADALATRLLERLDAIERRLMMETPGDRGAQGGVSVNKRPGE